MQNPNNAKSSVHQSDTCFLHTTHLGILKYEQLDRFQVKSSIINTRTGRFRQMYDYKCVIESVSRNHTFAEIVQNKIWGTPFR